MVAPRREWHGRHRRVVTGVDLLRFSVFPKKSLAISSSLLLVVPFQKPNFYLYEQTLFTRSPNPVESLLRDLGSGQK